MTSQSIDPQIRYDSEKEIIEKLVDQKMPEWSELTDEQKAAIVEEYIRFDKEITEAFEKALIEGQSEINGTR